MGGKQLEISGNQWIVWLLAISIIIVLGASFYKYFYTGDYTFVVEAPCDAATQQCYVRDCEADYCPPNNLSAYRVFALPAAEFKSCSDNSCLNICPSGEYKCEELFCSDQEEMSCSYPESIDDAT